MTSQLPNGFRIVPSGVVLPGDLRYGPRGWEKVTNDILDIGRSYGLSCTVEAMGRIARVVSVPPGYELVADGSYVARVGDKCLNEMTGQWVEYTDRHVEVADRLGLKGFHYTAIVTPVKVETAETASGTAFPLGSDRGKVITFLSLFRMARFTDPHLSRVSRDELVSELRQTQCEAFAALLENDDDLWNQFRAQVDLRVRQQAATNRPVPGDVWVEDAIVAEEENAGW